MKELLYGILCFTFFLLLYVKHKYPDQLQQPKHVGGIIVEKRNGFFLGYYMEVKYKEDSIETEFVYQIFYDRYEIGDTIKPLK